jgi:hypothetical protein
MAEDDARVLVKSEGDMTGGGRRLAKHLPLCFNQGAILRGRPGRGVDVWVQLVVPTLTALFSVSSGKA